MSKRSIIHNRILGLKIHKYPSDLTSIGSSDRIVGIVIGIPILIRLHNLEYIIYYKGGPEVQSSPVPGTVYRASGDIGVVNRVLSINQFILI